MLSREDGVTAVEYGLIGALIACVILSAVLIAGDEIEDTFCRVASALSEEVNMGSFKCSGSGSSDSNSAATTSDSCALALPAGVSPEMNTDYDNAGEIWNYEYKTGQRVAWLLQAVNSISPITGVYGLYDYNAKLVNNYTDAYNLFYDANGSGSTMNGHSVSDSNTDFPYARTAGGFNDFFEVTTADGSIYQIQQTPCSSQYCLQDSENSNYVANDYQAYNEKTGAIVSW